MTHPKPPNNFSCEDDSPKNDVTVDGIDVEEFIDTSDTIRGNEIEIRLGLLKNSYNRSNGEKEDIQQLLDLVVEERKQHHLDRVADATNVGAGLQVLLIKQKEKTASATASGKARLKAVKELSDEKAVGFHKCIDALKARLAALKKHSSDDKKDVAAKFTAKDTASRERILTLGKEQRDIRKDSKTRDNQLRLRDKDLAKTSDLLKISQRKLSEVHSTLTEVLRERDSFKRLNKTLASEATKLHTRLDGQAQQKREHSKEMSLLAVQKQQLALNTQHKKKSATKEKLEHAHNERKSLIRYTAQIRGEEKAKDMAMKEQVKKQKLDKATSRLSMAASAMNHQNYALRGGTFPPPTPTCSHDVPIGGVSIARVPISILFCSNFYLCYLFLMPTEYPATGAVPPAADGLFVRVTSASIGPADSHTVCERPPAGGTPSTWLDVAQV